MSVRRRNREAAANAAAASWEPTTRRTAVCEQFGIERGRQEKKKTEEKKEERKKKRKRVNPEKETVNCFFSMIGSRGKQPATIEPA